MVMHKGHYYHRPDSNHNHPDKQTCKGDYMTFLYKRGRKWLRFYHADVSIVDVDEVMNSKYWGKEGEWTPVLLMYR